MYEEFFTSTIEKYGYIDLENNRDQFNRLVKVIKSNIYGFNLKKVYLFDLNGQIIYSNIAEHVGYVLERGRNMQLDSAINGSPASALQYPGMQDSKGVNVEESLLESYYPIYEFMEGAINREKQVGGSWKYIRNDDEAQIKFEDSGCGIASENLDKVLEPFFLLSLRVKVPALDYRFVMVL